MAGRARVGLAARGVHERLWSGTGTRGCEERAVVRESGRRVPGRCSLGGRLCCPQPLLFIQQIAAAKLQVKDSEQYVDSVTSETYKVQF